MNRTATVTKSSTYTLTAIAVVVFILLSWIFADGLLVGPLWNAASWVESPLITYVLLLLIVAAGVAQANRIPEQGTALPFRRDTDVPGQTDEPLVSKLLLGNVFAALFWLPIRFFVGREWLGSGVGKVTEPAWMDQGAALQGYWQNAVRIPEEGRPPITFGWYRDFLQFMIDQNWAPWFAKLVVFGEILVGLGLLVGALTGIAAFFGTLLNFNFGLAGTASSNPVLFGLGVLLVLAWRTAGYWGLDRYLLPVLGTPWNPREFPVGTPVPAPAREGMPSAGGIARSSPR